MKKIIILSVVLVVVLGVPSYVWCTVSSAHRLTLNLYHTPPPNKTELEEALPWYFSSDIVPISETNRFKVYWEIETGDQVIFYSVWHCFMFQAAYGSDGTVKAIIPPSE